MPEPDFMKIGLHMFQEMGRPRSASFDIKIAIEKGEHLTWVGYCVPGKGEYRSEDIARRHMDQKDVLYRVEMDVEKIA